MPRLATKTDPNMNLLLKEAAQRENMIASIKKEVAEESDNIDNPVPLFQQLNQQLPA